MRESRIKVYTEATLTSFVPWVKPGWGSRRYVRRVLLTCPRASRRPWLMLHGCLAVPHTQLPLPPYQAAAAVAKTPWGKPLSKHLLLPGAAPHLPMSSCDPGDTHRITNRAEKWAGLCPRLTREVPIRSRGAKQQQIQSWHKERACLFILSSHPTQEEVHCKL